MHLAGQRGQYNAGNLEVVDFHLKLINEKFRIKILASEYALTTTTLHIEYVLREAGEPLFKF